MFSLVHSPAAERVKGVLKSGRLGELLAVHCDVFFAKGPAGTATFGEPRREHAHPTTFEALESKRELYNIGVYPLAMLAWLLKQKVRRVSQLPAITFSPNTSTTTWRTLRRPRARIRRRRHGHPVRWPHRLAFASGRRRAAHLADRHARHRVHRCLPPAAGDLVRRAGLAHPRA